MAVHVDTPAETHLVALLRTVLASFGVANGCSFGGARVSVPGSGLDDAFAGGQVLAGSEQYSTIGSRTQPLSFGVGLKCSRLTSFWVAFHNSVRAFRQLLQRLAIQSSCKREHSLQNKQIKCSGRGIINEPSGTALVDLRTTTLPTRKSTDENAIDDSIVHRLTQERMSKRGDNSAKIISSR